VFSSYLESRTTDKVQKSSDSVVRHCQNLSDYKNFLFFPPFSSNMGPTQPAIQCLTRALTPWIKRPGHEADYWPQTSVNNSWIYTSIPPIRRHSVVLSQSCTGTTLRLFTSTLVRAEISLKSLEMNKRFGKQLSRYSFRLLAGPTPQRNFFFVIPFYSQFVLVHSTRWGDF
jgi:hypothetical protein